MKKIITHGTWVIVLSIIIAVVFTIIPLPTWATWLRPLWLLMVLSYWALALENRIGMGVIWLLGILLDILQSTIFGEHSLVLCCCVFIIIKLKRKIRMSPLWQQACFISLLALFYQLIIVIVQSITGKPVSSLLFWLSIFTTGLFWPWVFVLLRDCRRRFRVS
jgi:rod shape-determining protein MreD